MIGQVCDKFDNMFSIGFQYQDEYGGMGCGVGVLVIQAKILK